jgi:predicted glycoside hydrolase/deacetylase ChbG (UPF0249 family)
MAITLLTPCPPEPAIGAALRRVVFHADDFGETVEITRGIIRAVNHGVVTSSSIMANMPGTRFALEQAPLLADRMSFGVHLNLCEGRPLTDVPGLTDDSGRFVSKRTLARKSFAGRLDLDQVRQEIATQVEHVVGHGIPVSHLDGHKHLHMLPGVRNVVVETARRFDLRRVRVMSERSWRPMRRPAGLVREAVAHGAARTFAGARLRFPARTLDIREFLGAAPHDLARRLGRMEGVTEVVCHPGTVAADAEKPGSCDRSVELEFLARPELRGALHDEGIELISYWGV